MCVSDSQKAPFSDPQTQIACNSTSLATLAQNLLTVSRSDPSAFDEAAGDFAQAMVAEGMATVPPPRTIGELVKWESLRRQYKRLDDKTVAGGLFDPVRPIRRTSGPVVEAEPGGEAKSGKKESPDSVGESGLEGFEV